MSRPNHCVQLYGADEDLLTGNVGRYLAEGLNLGDGLLVIATPAHISAILRAMKRARIDTVTALGARRIVFLDAQATLDQFLVAGQPDWELFEREIETAIGEIRSAPSGGLRAYGEMVGLLWNAGKYSAAIRLEQFWNQLLGERCFDLFCAYPIDIFGSEFQLAPLEALLAAHTHVVPAGDSTALESAIHHSMDDLLGRRAEGLRGLMRANLPPAPAAISRAEADILWLRNNIPDEAESILARARQYYHASSRYAEPAGQSR